MVSAQTTDIHQTAGVDLAHQPNLQPTHQAMVLSAEAQNREQVPMFLPQQTTSTSQMQLSYAARHDLPAIQAASQKFPQLPQQPSTQPQPLPKAPSTTKRATKALLIVDPDTNEPVDCQQVLPI